MNYYEYNKLINKILLEYNSVKIFAKEIGLTAKMLNAKLENKTDFKQQEIVKICDVLKIKETEISSYFFEKKV